MRIRPGTSKDFAAINRVELSAGTLFEGTHMAWAVGDTTPAAKLDRGAEEGTLWVAEIDNEVAGFLLAKAFERDFHIREVAVLRDWHGRGIGRDLVETAIAVAADRGFARVTLTTDRSLPWNAPWYARLGFNILAEAELSGRLAAQLASETCPELRCAMVRII